MIIKSIFRTILCVCVIPSALQAASPRPNIVFILSDDQAWTDYGFMGHPDIKTPHLDRLASRSLVFERGYVASPLCRPSLASMVTGLYPFQHGVTGNDVNGANNRAALDMPMRAAFHKHPSFIKTLTANGYLAHQSGKWWEGSFADGGFTHGMTHGDPKRGGRHGDKGLEIGRKGMKEIFDFMEQRNGKPFFTWYAPFLPHTPHNPPKRLLNKYTKKTDSKFIARYWAMCEWFDETCGQLLQYLDEKNLTNDTIVIYVTDNGWIQRPDNGRYAPRSKRSQYDGGIRTPIMVRWPGKVKPEERNELVNSIDLAPTILKACGMNIPKEMRGINILNKEELKKRKFTYGACYLHNAVDIHKPNANLTYRWLIDGNWKIILPNKTNITTLNNEKGTKNIELFNLIADPFEKNNLADSQQTIVKRLTRQLNIHLPTNEKKNL